MKEIHELTVLEIREAVAAKKFSAVDAAQACLSHVQRLDPKINAILSLLNNQAIESAQAVDAKIASGHEPGPLAGVPMMVKDNMQMLGTRTTAGSRILENYQSQFTATAVQKLKDAGAVIIGKTNLDEFAMGSSTENSGFYPTKNPYNPERIPGGSSGGSAAAVASRMVPAALGSDTGGSIRQPASHCGVVGLKPTYGRVSRYGLLAYGSSLDQIGPFARTVEDAALVAEVISGSDPKDSTSSPKAVPTYLNKLKNVKDLKSLRIGKPAEYFAEGLDTEVCRKVEDALDILKSLGAVVVDVKLPHSQYGIPTYYILATSEASSNLARYDGVHYGHRTSENADLISLYSLSRKEALGAEVKRRIMLGTFALSSGYYDAYYRKAQQARALINQDFDEAFRSCDIIAGPVSPTTAFKMGEKTEAPLQMYLSDIYTICVNLACLPAISIPCGLDSKGLPVGLQLIGKPFGEFEIFRAGAIFQRESAYHLTVPKLD